MAEYLATAMVNRYLYRNFAQTLIVDIPTRLKIVDDGRKIEGGFDHPNAATLVAHGNVGEVMFG